MGGGLAFCSHSCVSYPGSWISAPSVRPPASVIHSSGQDLTSERRFTPTSFLSPSPSLPSPHCSAWDLRETRVAIWSLQAPAPQTPHTWTTAQGRRAPADTALGNSTPPHTHFTGSVEAHGGPLGEVRKARPSQEEAVECSLTAWRLACAVWATGESSTPGSRVTIVGGRRAHSHSREGGLHAPPPHQSSNSYGGRKPPSTGKSSQMKWVQSTQRAPSLSASGPHWSGACFKLKWFTVRVISPSTFYCENSKPAAKMKRL